MLCTTVVHSDPHTNTAKLTVRLGLGLGFLLDLVSVSASVNLPLHHKVQKFSSGTGSPGWSRKKGRKTIVCVCFLLDLGVLLCVFAIFFLCCFLSICQV